MLPLVVTSKHAIQRPAALAGQNQFIVRAGAEAVWACCGLGFRLSASEALAGGGSAREVFEVQHDRSLAGEDVGRKNRHGGDPRPSRGLERVVIVRSGCFFVVLGVEVGGEEGGVGVLPRRNERFDGVRVAIEGAEDVGVAGIVGRELAAILETALTWTWGGYSGPESSANRVMAAW